MCKQTINDSNHGGNCNAVHLVVIVTTTILSMVVSTTEETPIFYVETTYRLGLKFT